MSTERSLQLLLAAFLLLGLSIGVAIGMMIVAKGVQ
jgi:hypothetical protein